MQNGMAVEMLQKLGGRADLRMVLNYSYRFPGHLASFTNNMRRAPSV